jgi:DNA-binding winged helix-turn-helix (wHTH) protein
VTLRFGPFTLDPETRRLTQGSRDLHLTTKAFDLLLALASESPKVLSKAVLQQRLWPETFVAEANLSNLIAEIRDALGDGARAPEFVRTVHRIGYAFCGEVRTGEIDQPPMDQLPIDRAPICWLQWSGSRFPLAAGEHIIGRDAEVAVQLDASTVSRRHARLMVTRERALLDDLGSKNGTYLGAARVTAPMLLADGDEIRIGSVLVTFHVRTGASTEILAKPRP